MKLRAATCVDTNALWERSGLQARERVMRFASKSTAMLEKAMLEKAMLEKAMLEKTPSRR